MERDRILIVDDSLAQAAQLRGILEGDYETVSAQTAERALMMIGSGEFSLVLLDVILPGMDGFMMLKKLQENPVTRHLPVILITSLGESDYEQVGLDLGAVDYIAKPFHPKVVKARVNTHIKLYRYRRQLEDQSMTDPLTGVPNRRRHDQHCLDWWREACRLGLRMSICIFDIDNFKAYNDRYGHQAGDRAIAEVAQKIAHHLRRSTDFFARYGGEEFVAVLLGDSAEKAYAHLCGIRQAVEAMQIPHETAEGPWLTVSVGGVTVLPAPGQPYERYFEIADTMLYDAKHLGRNRVVWMNEEMEQQREREQAAKEEYETDMDAEK